MSVKRNPNLGPSQIRAKKRRLFMIRLCIVSFFVLLVLFTLAIFSGHKIVKVQTITLSGNASVSDDEILSIVNRDLAGRYWYLFSKSNSLIFPRFKIKEDILNEIRTIKTLEVSWTDWQEIAISVSERKPHSVWCGEQIYVNDTECYFVDHEGYIFSQAPDFSGNIYVKNYGPLIRKSETEESNPIGSYFVNKEIYSEMFNLVQVLDKNNLSITSVIFDNYDYRFVLESGPEIIFNTENNVNNSFENLFSAIETKNLDLEKESQDIKYIDLRFEGKVVIGRKEI
jgi:hypothetical protein